MIKKTGGLIAILPERQRRTDLAICAMCLALLRYSVKTENEAKLPEVMISGVAKSQLLPRRRLGSSGRPDDFGDAM